MGHLGHINWQLVQGMASMESPKEGRSSGQRSASTGSDRVCGFVSIHHVYRLDEALARLGWSMSAFRAAQRRGLRVLKSGKRKFITGREIRRFLEADDAAAGSD